LSLLMARIDDRLVHGQVVIGCCEPLRARRLLLCDAAVAADPVLKGFFALATPEEIALEVHDVPASLARLEELERAGEAATTILLVARSTTMLRLCEGGATVERVHLGGAHARPGADELWPGFFLDLEDRAALRALLARGIEVQVQTVPGAACVDATGRLDARP
jgi:mannose/fructose/N-acetylgalactosamine-specific phosphotransferase system component IIB